jgi:uncharacterized protein YbjT (DUF2867 family)
MRKGVRMSFHNQILLITGATGQQGGAAISYLHSKGWYVRALTRDPESIKAKALAELGVEVVKGDLEDRASLDRALKYVYGVFSVTNFWDGFPQHTLGYEGEVRQGKNLANAAKAAGVKHYVFSSVGSAYAYPSKVPHVKSKQEIERHIRSIGLPATIIRPVFFMDNFNSPFMDYGQKIRAGRLELPLRKDLPFQLIAVEDVGAFAALVFEKPHEFINTAFDVAGDQLTPPQIAEVFTKLTGEKVDFVGDPSHIEEIRSHSPEFALMYEAFNELGSNAFIPALRLLMPGMLNLESFLHKTGWEMVDNPSPILNKED